MSTPDNNKPNMGRAELLSPGRHGALRFHQASNFAFAAEWLYVPVHLREISRQVPRFPVLFYPLPQGGAMPCMLLTSKDKSALSAQLNWQGGVLPDVMRLYPFGVHRISGGNIPTVYPDAPHFVGKGEKIITSKGKPTQRLQRIIKQLVPVQQAFDETRSVMKELLALDILQPVTFTLSHSNGKRRRVTLLACPDRSVLKNNTLSPRLRTLLYVHQQSCRRLLERAQSAAVNTVPAPVPAAIEAPEVAESEAVVEAVPGDTPNAVELVRKACEQFGVSIDDLRSRKRSDTIKRAREALAVDASACGCLADLAIQLERSVETVKKWM